MPAPCVKPSDSFYQKMLEAVAFSERNRRLIDEITEAYCDAATTSITRQRRLSGVLGTPTRRDIITLAELKASKDPRVTDAISNERWGCRLATMYGLAALAQAQYEREQT